MFGVAWRNESPAKFTREKAAMLTGRSNGNRTESKVWACSVVASDGNTVACSLVKADTALQLDYTCHT
jgi:hypothetical protein